MSRKDQLNALYSGKPLNGPAPPAGATRVKSGAIAAMSHSLQHLAHSAAEMQMQLQSGTTLVDLDPGRVDDSIVQDRIAEDADDSYVQLRSSIAESGQQVPILVRPHPTIDGRYQIAYGHRRLRAARDLGRPVRAIVRPLSDSELVVAQGKENLERRDLSFIERAVFALRLERAGFDRATLCAALAADKGDVSRFISVAASIPMKIVAAIGPAPKAGRSRWMALADALSKNEGAALAVISDSKFRAMNSDARFTCLVSALSIPPTEGKQAEFWAPADMPAVQIKVARSASAVSLSVPRQQLGDFAEFLIKEVPDLYEKFRRRKEERR